MDLLFEIIFGIVFEGISEASTSKKVPVPIRIMTTVLTAVVFLSVIAIIAFMGIVYFKDNNFLGILLLLFDIVLVALLIRKIMKYMKKSREEYE
ncbi:MAG: hypothetical protein ACI4I7_00285 [Oscillospiraceae bacterium]